MRAAGCKTLGEYMAWRREQMTPEERLELIPPEERLKGLPPEERWKGLSADEILRSLPEDVIRELRKQLEEESNGRSEEDEG
jgi:hypothetical protein